MQGIMESKQKSDAERVVQVMVQHGRCLKYQRCSDLFKNGLLSQRCAKADDWLESAVLGCAFRRPGTAIGASSLAKANMNLLGITLQLVRRRDQVYVYGAYSMIAMPNVTYLQQSATYGPHRPYRTASGSLC